MRKTQKSKLNGLIKDYEEIVQHDKGVIVKLWAQKVPSFSIINLLTSRVTIYESVISDLKRLNPEKKERIDLNKWWAYDPEEVKGIKTPFENAVFIILVALYTSVMAGGIAYTIFNALYN